jgi:ubiquinone/menaquinone biosynthesis C-methylase UbiE
MGQPDSGYVFDRRQADQERLIRSSDALSPFAAEACARAGLAPGGRAIDVGCGPLGALPALASLVGSGGQVVGLDDSGEAVALARSVLTQRGLTTVTLVEGDLHSIAMSAICPPGPFDVAYVRRFLVHQQDPIDSLRRIASLVRPGGRIVAHEIPPASGYPALTPSVPALQRVDALVHAGVKARGGTYDAAHQFATLSCKASLRLISQRGFLPAAEPVSLLETFQAVLRSLRSGLIATHVTTEHEIEDLLATLERAKAGDYVSAFANLYIEMIAEVP